jgi:thiamine pyrophosphokinase
MANLFQDFQPNVIILGGGDYPSHPLPLSLLKKAEKVVCCDSAAYEFMRHGGKPWKIVGDCDSILFPRNAEEQKLLDENRHLIRQITEQADNDLTKAVRYCLEHGLQKIAIVGATGRREDHTLGNISLLNEYMHMGADVRMLTDYGLFVACHDSQTFEIPIPKDFVFQQDDIATRQKSTQVSVFNINAHDFSSEGLRYPLYDITRWWEGTLNEAISPTVRIDASGDYLVYICYPDELSVE